MRRGWRASDGGASWPAHRWRRRAAGARRALRSRRQLRAGHPQQSPRVAERRAAARRLLDRAAAARLLTDAPSRTTRRVTSSANARGSSRARPDCRAGELASDRRPAPRARPRLRTPIGRAPHACSARRPRPARRRARERRPRVQAVAPRSLRRRRARSSRSAARRDDRAHRVGRGDRAARRRR